MTPAEMRAMQAQLRTDPRVRALQTRGNGAITSTQLQALGYQVPDGFHYSWGGRAGQGSLLDNQQHWLESGGPAIVMGTVAGAGALGGVPGIAGVGSGGGAAAGGGAAFDVATNSAAGIDSIAGMGVNGGGGMGFLDWLRRGADVAGAAGEALGAHSQASAQNRGAAFEGQAILERLLQDRENSRFNQSVAREQEGRASGQDAWRRLMAAERTLNPGPRPQLSPYSIAPRQTTDAERTGAEAMRGEVMKRLEGGNPIQMPTERPMTVDPSLLRAGRGESTSGWLAPLLTYLERR